MIVQTLFVPDVDCPFTHISLIQVYYVPMHTV